MEKPGFIRGMDKISIPGPVCRQAGGVCFDMRMSGNIESVPVLVAIGVTETGRKLVLGLQSGDKESASNWREFFKDLKNRGLKKEPECPGKSP